MYRLNLWEGGNRARAELYLGQHLDEVGRDAHGGDFTAGASALDDQGVASVPLSVEADNVI